MNLFGKKKVQAPPPKLTDSIHLLREAQMMLDKRETHLQKQLTATRAEAKEKLKAKDKKGCMFLLKRAKLIEGQINQIYGKKANLDVQVMALENAQSNKDMFNVMRVGKDALKQAVVDTDIDKVSEVMEDISESIQMTDEVNDALSSPIGPAMDEDELNAELAEMESELVDQSLMEAPQVPVNIIPVAASTATVTTPSSQQHSTPVAAAPHKSKKELDKREEDELRELQMSMGM